MKKKSPPFEPRQADASRRSLHPPSFILHPSKRRFGQNFLVDRNVVDRIVAAVQPRSDETIVEIGPGLGALTARLVEKTGRVIAIEFDRNLLPSLRKKFAGATTLNLIEGDALTTDFCAAIRPAQSARVVANLPYNIATAILQRLIEQRECISEMVLMLQREVVDRITAEAGSSERGYLSVLVEAYCEAEKLFDVPPQAFRPAPKVWSTVVSLRVRPKIAEDLKDEALLWQVVSAGFAHRRKTILNNLRDAPAPIQELLKKRGGASIVLCDACIPPLRRAETLTLEEWALLVNAI
ncbi:MAG TPA: 16S rRNA (adenine(1518)-N(6)/adenine(1519)-N(6))-dimethyltransferase RsmA [Pyrinomonadaceae bacterium]|nr:16S rRNA (adenine(1518)-N(6)/adenine(1519)-N(6))-dimethyltransferase RsmA [Pyrinomonadaceae bacterium]